MIRDIPTAELAVHAREDDRELLVGLVRLEHVAAAEAAADAHHGEDHGEPGSYNFV